ncbi:MAG TPA: hypothetical protein GX715_05580 [Armatimonadetes bacterium]|nr:hypothetical protein [Armatimonadota bacterium]
MAASDRWKMGRPTSGGDLPGRQRERILLWVLLFLGLRTLLPLAVFLPRPVAVPAAMLLAMLVALWGPRVAAACSLPARWGLPLFILFGICSFAVAGVLPGAATPHAAVLLHAFSDLFLIAAAIALGQALAALFREPNLLVPAAIAAAVIDYWGVYYGTTRAVIEQHSEWVPKLSVHVPVPTSPGLPDLSLGIGLGDFVFLTLFLASARRFGLRERRTFWLSFLFLVSAMSVVLLFDRNVPALVPMSAAFLLANAGRFRFQRSELRAMLYAALILAVVVGLVLVFRYG